MNICEAFQSFLSSLRNMNLIIESGSLNEVGWEGGKGFGPWHLAFLGSATISFFH